MRARSRSVGAVSRFIYSKHTYIARQRAQTEHGFVRRVREEQLHLSETDYSNIYLIFSPEIDGNEMVLTVF